MVGEGDLWAEWQALGRELGLGERVHWVGNVPAIGWASTTTWRMRW